MLSLLSNLWSKDKDSPKPITKEALISRLAQYGIIDGESFCKELIETGGVLVGPILFEQAPDRSINRTLTIFYDLTKPSGKDQMDQMEDWFDCSSTRLDGYVPLMNNWNQAVQSLTIYHWDHRNKKNQESQEYSVEIYGLNKDIYQQIHDHPEWPQLVFDGHNIRKVEL